MKEYDLIVIGAGSGGLVASTTANRKGLKTALIEESKIGGDCTHYGCVPSKALINAAKAYFSLQNMDKLGIDVELPEVNFGKIMEHVDQIVQGIYQHETPDVFEDQGIDVFIDKTGAKFIDENTISIGDEKIKAKHFVICTGSSPRIIGIPGIDKVKVLHNVNFWKLRNLPKKIVFIGGGVISAEIGQSLSRLGSDVCILDMQPRILSVTDEQIGSYLTGQMEEENVKIICNASTERFEGSDTLVYTQEGREHKVKADYFFMAVGRIPNVEGMDLEKAGVDYSDKGIKTNDYLQTSASNIYACGDVTTPLKFTHTASHQANICIDNIMEGNTKENDLSVFPWGIFTEPQIGHVGLTHKQAIEKYGEENISIFEVEAQIDRFITDRKTGGLLKVIFNSKDHVVGAEAVGEHAAEWIQHFTTVIKNEIPAQEMAETIFAYPTYSEIVKKAFTRYLKTK